MRIEHLISSRSAYLLMVGLLWTTLLSYSGVSVMLSWFIVIPSLLVDLYTSSLLVDLYIFALLADLLHRYALLAASSCPYSACLLASWRLVSLLLQLVPSYISTSATFASFACLLSIRFWMFLLCWEVSSLLLSHGFDSIPSVLGFLLISWFLGGFAAVNLLAVAIIEISCFSWFMALLVELIRRVS